MSEIEKLADCPFDGSEAHLIHSNPYYPRWVNTWRVQCVQCGTSHGEHDSQAEAITAWNTRQHATALEIGRGIGREECAKVCDERAKTATENAAIAHRRGGDLLEERADGLSKAAAAIRAASPALDMEGMVKIGAKAIDELHERFLPDDLTSDMEARAVLASLIGTK